MIVNSGCTLVLYEKKRYDVSHYSMIVFYQVARCLTVYECVSVCPRAWDSGFDKILITESYGMRLCVRNPEFECREMALQ